MTENNARIIPTINAVDNFLATTQMGAEICRLINSPRLKLLYDVYHMQINEGCICDTITDYVDQMGHIHVADAPGRHEPGTGEINYTKVIRHLEATYVGHNKTIVNIQRLLLGDVHEYDVQLEMENNLREVVVAGNRAAERKDGSSENFSAEELNNIPSVLTHSRDALNRLILLIEEHKDETILVTVEFQRKDEKSRVKQ